jgi:hypothetical protein
MVVDPAAADKASGTFLSRYVPQKLMALLGIPVSALFELEVKYIPVEPLFAEVADSVVKYPNVMVALALVIGSEVDPQSSFPETLTAIVPRTLNAVVVVRLALNTALVPIKIPLPDDRVLYAALDAPTA